MKLDLLELFRVAVGAEEDLELVQHKVAALRAAGAFVGQTRVGQHLQSVPRDVGRRRLGGDDVGLRRRVVAAGQDRVVGQLGQHRAAFAHQVLGIEDGPRRVLLQIGLPGDLLGGQRCLLGLEGAHPLGVFVHELAEIVLVVAEDRQAGVQLRRRRLAAQDRQEQLLDHLGIVLLAGHDLGNAVVRIPERVAQDRAVDQVQHRPEQHGVGALALASAFTGRLAEQVEEAAGDRRRRVQ